MEFIKSCGLPFLLILVATNMVQPLTSMSSKAQETELQKQLKAINKPAVKSFQTSHGDIYDCVEIHKQLAFDHPLLKNHTIQMEPTSHVSKLMKASSSFTTSQLLPNNVTCPEGTVLIKRIQKKDLLVARLPLAWKNSKADEDLVGYDAGIQLNTNISGIIGNINVWQLLVEDDQLSATYIKVASQDGSVDTTNLVAAGWIADTYDYKYPNNYTRLSASWTKDNGNSSGCFDVLCPGFVQISQRVTLGMRLLNVSTYEGIQYEIYLTIQQDDLTGNWWISLATVDKLEKIGYYPKELFTTLADGATQGQWGGQVTSDPGKPTPTMGSGFYPEEGYSRSCYIRQMTLLDKSHAPINLDTSKLEEYNSKPHCYKVDYLGDDGRLGHRMFFGGPSDCKA